MLESEINGQTEIALIMLEIEITRETEITQIMLEHRDNWRDNLDYVRKQRYLDYVRRQR